MRYTKEKVPNQVIVDTESGEVKGAVVRTVCESPEDFIKLYLNSVDDLIVLEPRLLQVLLVCVKHSTYHKTNGQEGNFFQNNKAFKQDCKRALQQDNISNGAINLYIHRLAEQMVIIRYCRGTYVLNPKYFFKGTITKKSRLQLIATYETQDNYTIL